MASAGAADDHDALYGEKAMLEIEGDRAVLTERSGAVEDLSVTDAPDDSYHSSWFGSVVGQFENAIASAARAALASCNLDEARTALGWLRRRASRRLRRVRADCRLHFYRLKAL